MLFEEAAKRYMDDKRGRLRACTLAGYESALALHVLHRWGETELEAITPEPPPCKAAAALTPVKGLNGHLQMALLLHASEIEKFPAMDRTTVWPER